MIRYFKKTKSLGRKKYLSAQKHPPLTAQQRTSRAKGMGKQVEEIIAVQDDNGRWINRKKLETRGMTFGDRIETSVFIGNMRMLSDYLALFK